MYGQTGADQLFDYECDGPTLLNGGRGNDYSESWSSSFEGYADACDTVTDRVLGGRGSDAAVVDGPDTVRGTEAITRRS